MVSNSPFNFNDDIPRTNFQFNEALTDISSYPNLRGSNEQKRNSPS